MSEKNKHIIESLNEAQLREHIVHLEERLEGLRDQINRLEEERRASASSWTEYKNRVGEMNEALRNDVKALLLMLSAKTPTDVDLESFQEWKARSVGGPIEARDAETLVPQDSIEVMRNMTRGVIRSYFAEGKLVSDSAIAAMAKKSAKEAVHSVVAAEFGMDRYGEVKNGSRTMNAVKLRVQDIVDEALDTDEFRAIIDSAAETAKKKFLSRETTEYIVKFAGDTMRSRFHDRLSGRVSDVASELAETVVKTTFEQVLLEEMPFLKQFKSLIRLGLEPTEGAPDF